MNASTIEPRVVAIMLTANRPEYARRAVENFRAQTYRNKFLMVFDGSLVGKPLVGIGKSAGINRTYTIGDARNEAVKQSSSDILIHWDDDDYSHPKRIAEQVALLTSSGADCVGFNEMLFWREPIDQQIHCGAAIPGEAWLYSNPHPHYALGTSLCYTRSFWEQRPFEATSQGEDLRFIAGGKCASISSIGSDGTPRLVARIHSGNTSSAYKPSGMIRAKEWTRVPQRDEEMRGLFA